VSAGHGPLEGVRILDVGHLIAGPMTASVLGDFGADVIKIEQPGVGDPLRWNYPHEGVGLFHKVQGRNKRNITLNLASRQGRGIFHELTRKSDVIVENFRPGVMERLVGDWATLSQLNPGLIYCRVSGWGQTGPYKERTSFGRIAEAFSGFAAITGEADGPPMHSTMSLGDSVAAVWAANAVNMALYWRDARGGTGQVIDLALYEPLYRQIEQQIAVMDRTGTPPHRAGNQNDGTPVMGSYETADGKYFSFSANTVKSIRAVMRAVDLEGDSRFADFHGCSGNHAALHSHIREFFATRTAAQLQGIFDSADAPGTMVMNAGDLISNPHVLAREMVIEVPDDDIGPLRMQGVVPKFSETPGAVRHAGQRLGQSNAQVYEELLGFDDDKLDELRNAGVI
jgi:formyl-CoA transferase